MKISVITVTLNNIAGLKRTLASVRDQRLPEGVELEHIVVDGMSTDGTDEFLRTQHPEIKVVKAPPRGVYNAINCGMAVAGGDIVGLVHGGDAYSSPDVIAVVAEAFADPDTDFIYGDVHYAAPVTGATSLLPWEAGAYETPSRYYTAAECSKATMLHGFAPPHPSLYMRHNVAAAMGKYREDYRVAADFEMFIRLFFKSAFRGRYVSADMVCMLPGGMSGNWRNRLWLNNTEKVRAFRDNGMRVWRLSIYRHYLYVLKSFLWPRKQ